MVKRFSVIEAATGRILRNGVCPDDAFDLQAQAGEIVRETDNTIGDETHYLHIGEETEEFRAYPERPSEAHQFDFTTETWFDPRTPEDLALELEKTRERSMQRMNERIAQVRQIFITDLPGQEMIYLRKEQEGRSYLSADPEPETLADYPFLAREVGKTAPTAYEVAQIYMNMAAIWLVVGPVIENIRLETKTAIASATTQEELETIIETLMVATQVENLMTS